MKGIREAAMIGILWVGGCGTVDGPSNSKAPAEATSHEAGSIFTLKAECLGATSHADYAPMQKYLNAKDKDGAVEMAAQGRVVPLKAGTQVKTIERVDLLGDEVDVRVVSGQSAGRELWITDQPN